MSSKQRTRSPRLSSNQQIFLLDKYGKKIKQEKPKINDDSQLNQASASKMIETQQKPPRNSMSDTGSRVNDNNSSRLGDPSALSGVRSNSLLQQQFQENEVLHYNVIMGMQEGNDLRLG